MRENKQLQASARSFLARTIWFLIGTLLSFSVFAQTTDTQLDVVAKEPVNEQAIGLYYDSSIQRSNFLTFNPDYYKRLDAEVANRRTQFFWKLRFDGQSLSTKDNINSQIAGATFAGRFTYKFMENLKFKAQANLTVENGRSQSIFGDQEPGTGVYPRQVLVEYQPKSEVVTLQAGLINQQFFQEPLFIGNLPFVGLSEKFELKGDRYSLGLRLQQLIPSSYTNATRVSEKEDIPYFYTESVEGKFTISRSNFIMGRVTHFQYQNLPSVLAFNSFIYGNTVTNTDVKNAEFIYGFNGWLTNLMFEQKFTEAFSVQAIWNTIVNNKAPSNAGEAQTLKGVMAYDTGRWIYGTYYTNYFIESDAVPAAYNSHTQGHNNRIGQGLGLYVESKDWGVQFKGEYVEADLLNQSSRRIDGLQQDNQKTIYFSVETLYDFI